MVQHSISRKFMETVKSTTWLKYLGFWRYPDGQELIFHNQEFYDTENTLIYSIPTKKINFFDVLKVGVQ